MSTRHWLVAIAEGLETKCVYKGLLLVEYWWFSIQWEF